jgi:hypothetical protein
MNEIALSCFTVSSDLGLGIFIISMLVVALAAYYAGRRDEKRNAQN